MLLVIGALIASGWPSPKRRASLAGRPFNCGSFIKRGAPMRDDPAGHTSLYWAPLMTWLVSPQLASKPNCRPPFGALFFARLFRFSRKRRALIWRKLLRLLRRKQRLFLFLSLSLFLFLFLCFCFCFCFCFVLASLERRPRTDVTH